MQEYIVVVTGSRDLDHRWKSVIHESLDKYNICELYHGTHWGGADLYASEYCKKNNVQEFAFPANWKELGRSAGPKRNQQMIDSAQISSLAKNAYWHSKINLNPEEPTTQSSMRK